MYNYGLHVVKYLVPMYSVSDFDPDLDQGYGLEHLL